jgi:putative ATPase
MVGGAEPETFGLTRGPKEREVEKWIRRASDEVGRWLGEVRDRIFTLAEVARHHLVLDANAATGFLTWEAVRRAPEGGVVALASELAETLREQVERLPALTRPRIIESRLADLPSAAAALEAGLGFDRIVGYRALGGVSDKPAAARSLAAVLRPGGIVVLAEAIPRRSQRLYALADPIDLDPYLHAAWRAAEEQVYAAPDDPLTGWDVPDLTKALEDAGLTVEADTDRRRREVKVTPAVLDRWWSTGLDGDRAPYRARLSASLGAGEVAAIEAWARRRWLDRAVSWETTILFARCRLTA